MTAWLTQAEAARHLRLGVRTFRKRVASGALPKGHHASDRRKEAGCSAHEIAAVLGHETLQMVENYTKKAAQKKMASAAITKLERKRNK